MTYRIIRVYSHRVEQEANPRRLRPITFALADEVREALERAAKEDNRTVSALVRLIVEEFLKRKEEAA